MKILQNISLKPFNTFGMDVPAKYFAFFQTSDQLLEILSSDICASSDTLLLGGGSNLLFTKNINGIVLKDEIKGIELLQETDEHYFVKVGAGEVWHDFVMYCVQKGYAGLENLALIPGCVGASPMQNIGAYGVEIKDVFHSLEAMHIKDKSVNVFLNKDCEFGYRESVFKNKYKNQFAITSVTFKLQKKPSYNITYGAISKELENMGVKDLSLHAISQAVINIRQSKLPNPIEIGNAGSFFKNPEIDVKHFETIQHDYPSIIGYATGENRIKLAAGWLIEQCGWKGYREGDAGCYAKQALVLVNYGNAKGEDVLQLSEKIIASVEAKFGVRLEREVNIM